MKKSLLLIVGILLIFFGFIISVGVAITLLEESPVAYPTGIVVFIFMLLGIAPVAGGGFLCWRALSQRGSVRATASSVVQPGNAPIKGFLLIVGILLILSGCIVSLASAVEFVEASSDNSVVVDTMVFMLLGIAPIAGGGFLGWWALSRRGSGVE